LNASGGIEKVNGAVGMEEVPVQLFLVVPGDRSQVGVKLEVARGQVRQVDVDLGRDLPLAIGLRDDLGSNHGARLGRLLEAELTNDGPEREAELDAAQVALGGEQSQIRENRVPTAGAPPGAQNGCRGDSLVEVHLEEVVLTEPVDSLGVARRSQRP
jgi:hypothetical protein